MRVTNTVPPKVEYEKKEIDDALVIFSTQLLRIRDGKTRGIKPDGNLWNLTKELIRAAKEEGGYPDSDDSNSDEDGDEETGKASFVERKSTAINQNGKIKEINYKDGGVRTQKRIFLK